jgi:hypothetical protein
MRWQAHELVQKVIDRPAHRIENNQGHSSQKVQPANDATHQTAFARSFAGGQMNAHASGTIWHPEQLPG